jgi:hypothetical protein
MELTQEELIKRKIQINKRKLVADIILIIVILGITMCFILAFKKEK